MLPIGHSCNKDKPDLTIRPAALTIAQLLVMHRSTYSYGNITNTIPSLGR